MSEIKPDDPAILQYLRDNAFFKVNAHEKECTQCREFLASRGEQGIMCDEGNKLFDLYDNAITLQEQHNGKSK